MPLAVIAALLLHAPTALAKPPAPAVRPIILAHYMPWFVAKPIADHWGWHWTMNAFDPDQIDPDGRRPIASHNHPLIGPYDSSDPDVIEYHFLLMKLAGIDGIVVDWYGTSDLNDYPKIHQNTTALFAAASNFSLKIAICYEDQTIPKLVEARKIETSDRVKHAREMFAWLQDHWFAHPAYLKCEGRPVLLSFGFDGLSDDEWGQALPVGPNAPIYLSEHRRRPCAAGAFDWPIPNVGLAAVDRFHHANRDHSIRMPVAFPRFHDIYSQAKVGPSYGAIDDNHGETFSTTLRTAITSGASMVQLATWNDWGEGTNIEPSIQFGYRDLETIQRLRRDTVDPAFETNAAALRLPRRLYDLRKKPPTAGETGPTIAEISRHLANGECAKAERLLESLEHSTR
jgi:hypothetical protein